MYSGTMTNHKKPKVTLTFTRKEADWLLNLLDRKPGWTPRAISAQAGV